jgi:sugar fermentation stimulation protein A
MLFPRPLVRGRLVQRYKRFFADVELDGGGPVTAHVANPGAMLGVKSPGQPVWLAPVDDPKRSLKYTLELVEQDGALVGVNTHHPNRLAAEAIAGGVIPELAGYAVLRREVRYDGDRRVDFLLEDPARPPCWVEVKNVHFARAPGLAEFPDCVAARSTKHLKALGRRVEAGERAVALFVVQRMDCEAFSACADLDPAFAAGLDAAAAEGVEVLVYACRMGLDGIAIERPIAWRRSTLTP